MSKFIRYVIFIFLAIGFVACRPSDVSELTAKQKYPQLKAQEIAVSENYVMRRAVEEHLSAFAKSGQAGASSVKSFLPKFRDSGAQSIIPKMNALVEEIKKTFPKDAHDNYFCPSELYLRLKEIDDYYNDEKFSSLKKFNISGLVPKGNDLRVERIDVLYARKRSNILRIASGLEKAQSIQLPQNVIESFMAFAGDFFSAFAHNADKDLYLFGRGVARGGWNVLSETVNTGADGVSYLIVKTGNTAGYNLYWEPRSQIMKLGQEQGLKGVVLATLHGVVNLPVQFALAMAEGRSEDIGYQLVNVEMMLLSFKAGNAASATTINVPKFGLNFYPCAGGTLCFTPALAVASSAVQIPAGVITGFSMSGSTAVLNAENALAQSTQKVLASEGSALGNWGKPAQSFVEGYYSSPAKNIRSFPTENPIRLTSPKTTSGIKLESGHSALSGGQVTGFGWRHILDRHTYGSGFPKSAQGSLFPAGTTFGELLEAMRALAQKANNKTEVSGTFFMGGKNVECTLVLRNGNVISFYPKRSW